MQDIQYSKRKVRWSLKRRSNRNTVRPPLRPSFLFSGSARHFFHLFLLRHVNLFSFFAQPLVCPGSGLVLRGCMARLVWECLIFLTWLLLLRLVRACPCRRACPCQFLFLREGNKVLSVYLRLFLASVLPCFCRDFSVDSAVTLGGFTVLSSASSFDFHQCERCMWWKSPFHLKACPGEIVLVSFVFGGVSDLLKSAIALEFFSPLLRRPFVLV